MIYRYPDGDGGGNRAKSKLQVPKDRLGDGWSAARFSLQLDVLVMSECCSDDGDIVFLTSGMSKALTTLVSDGRDAQHVSPTK